MTDTPLSRIADFLAARQRYDDRGDTITLEVTTVRRGRLDRHPLLVTDLQALLSRLRDLCDDCVACEVCEAWLCRSCGVGVLSSCDGPMYHCADNPECVADCGPCVADMTREERAEQARDAAWEGCAG